MGIVPNVALALLLINAGGAAIAQVQSEPSLKPASIDIAKGAFAVSDTYRTISNRRATISIVSALSIVLPSSENISEAESPGFLPVLIGLSGGSCYMIKADYQNGHFLNSSISRASCGSFSYRTNEPAPVMPRPGLRFVNRSWGFSAWVDDQTGRTIIVNDRRPDSPVVVTTSMKVISINALRSPDTSSAEITFVGQLGGEASMVTAQLSV